MRAVGLMKHGGPEVLEVLEVPEVHAGPGQVRLRVHAAAVNPTDIMARNGSRAEQQKVDPPPYVPGMDAAGIVDEVGDGVSTDLQVGDAVMAMVEKYSDPGDPALRHSARSCAKATPAKPRARTIQAPATTASGRPSAAPPPAAAPGSATAARPPRIAPRTPRPPAPAATAPFPAERR